MTDNTNLKRRNFLLGVGLGSVGAAAAVLGAKALMGEPEKAGIRSGEEKAQGYRLTEHIGNYYRTTRV